MSGGSASTPQCLPLAYRINSDRQEKVPGDRSRKIGEVEQVPIRCFPKIVMPREAGMTTGGIWKNG